MNIADRLPASRTPRFPEVVVFDLDGLLVDTERLDWEASKIVAWRHGVVVDDEFMRRAIGRRLADIEPDFDRRFGYALRWQAFAREVAGWREDYIARHGIPWKVGAIDLIDYLDSEGIAFAVATSTAKKEAVARMGEMFPRFRTAAFGDEVTNGKPAPDIYLLALERLGATAEGCMALEDSLHGVEAAGRAGLTVIMVPDLVPPHEGVRYICRSLLGVRDWLMGRAENSPVRHRASHL